MTGVAGAGIRPEKRLLFSCARTSQDSAVAEGILALVRGKLDWPYLLASAEENCVTPLLHQCLKSVCPGDVPLASMEQLEESSRRHAHRSLYLTTELFRVLDRFRAEGLLAIPYKGPVLAAQACGRRALRQFDDLDIVLRQRDMAKACDLMNSLGYGANFSRSFSPRATVPKIPGEYAFMHQEGRSRVELHTERTMRHFPKPLNLPELGKRLEPVSLSGREIWTFSAEDALPILCVHGAKDFWERLSWIADIAELAQIPRALNWEAAFHEARRLGAERMLDLGLFLASDLLGAELPEGVERRVRGDHAVGFLAAQVRGNLLGERRVRMGMAKRSFFRLRMGRSFLSGVRYILRLATAPAEQEGSFTRLSQPLSPLGAALRPFRLLRKYGLGRSRGSADFH